MTLVRDRAFEASSGSDIQDDSQPSEHQRTTAHFREAAELIRIEAGHQQMSADV